MTFSRDKLLRQLSEGDWHFESELGPTPYEGGVVAWIRLLRLSGYTIEERETEGITQYRLVATGHDTPAA